ncbi:beta-1,4-N-acetylgalactosamyltransferase [Helicobacter sp. 13S00401-1]|uniref:beta-1,4-N-acetylgalactosamyltransferase n=1 Tax=Helicobacter sp. 13S00401-1 TaxID=1905758 RepID=UPI0015555800|nr:beta-1,4-N-acetylgalactosamyltransferase [Helicobacter sp. 13S00401-1]
MLKKGFWQRNVKGFRKVKKPIKPYAFIRVCNEIPTLKASLESIVFLERGVIVYNDCTDGSEEVILEFCKKYSDFKAYKYPHKVKRPYAPGEVFPEGYKELYEYYNFALDKIPKDEWLLKIDVDQIYMQDITEESFKLIEYENDIVCYPRVNLHVLDGEVLVSKDIPLSDVDDHWLIFNHNLSFKMCANSHGVMEVLVLPHSGIRVKKSSINSFHFPVLKKQRFVSDKSKFFTWEEFKARYKEDSSKLIRGGYTPLSMGEEILDLDLFDEKLPEILEKIDYPYKDTKDI